MTSLLHMQGLMAPLLFAANVMGIPMPQAITTNYGQAIEAQLRHDCSWDATYHWAANVFDSRCDGK
jgi:hypothetical protein